MRGLLLLLSGCLDFGEGIPCNTDDNCPTGFTCSLDNLCRSPDDAGDVPSECPADVMVSFGSFEMDGYESSRADATQTSSGADESIACSVAGVLPWEPSDFAVAEAACFAAGKRLCTLDEFEIVCHADDDRTYPYGDTYGEGTCNDRSGDGVLQPTGQLADCVDATGQVYDLVGNLAEACPDCLSGGLGTHGGGLNGNEQFSARCGGANNVQNSSGDPPGIRCCR